MAIAYIISVPLTLVMIKIYTRSFIESASISVWIFIVALLVILFVSILTLIIQLERAYRENPAMVIKDE